SSPNQTCADSHVFTRPNGEAGYFLRSPSRHSNTITAAPSDPNSNPNTDPPRAPFAEADAYPTYAASSTTQLAAVYRAHRDCRLSTIIGRSLPETPTEPRPFRSHRPVSTRSRSPGSRSPACHSWNSNPAG